MNLMGIVILGMIRNKGIEALAADIALTAVTETVLYKSVRTGCLISKKVYINVPF